MTTRTQEENNSIAEELMDCCPTESFADHNAIAEAIRNGKSREYILNMEQANAYPDTYVWLKGELEPEEERAGWQAASLPVRA
jgi:hypothetical protein